MQARIRSELEFSASVVLSGEEVVPRFRILAPEGETVVFLPLPEDLGERVRRVSLVRAYMAWRMASGFVVSSESVEPDAVMAVGVTRAWCSGLLRPIVRNPISLGPVRDLGTAEIGEGFPQLLPSGLVTTVDPETLKELKQVFGPGGEFEARPLES